MSLLADYFIAGLLLVGGFALIGSFGLAKLSDFYKRAHRPTKATTLGAGSILIASSLHLSLRGPTLSLHELLITLFLFISAPVSAHLLVKAGEGSLAPGSADEAAAAARRMSRVVRFLKVPPLAWPRTEQGSDIRASRPSRREKRLS